MTDLDHHILQVSLLADDPTTVPSDRRALRAVVDALVHLRSDDTVPCPPSGEDIALTLPEPPSVPRDMSTTTAPRRSA